MFVTPSADEAADVVALSAVLSVLKATQTTKTEAAEERCNKGCAKDRLIATRSTKNIYIFLDVYYLFFK